MVEHAVFLHVPVDDGRSVGTDLHRLTVLHAEVDVALHDASAGEVDGTEVLGHEWVLFAYGQSGEAMVDALTPVLQRWQLPSGSALLVRHGDLADADAVERPVSLPVAGPGGPAFGGVAPLQQSPSA